MASPGDEVAAGADSHGRLRASHADREQVINIVKAAFVQGRLNRDEFELRVGEALGSRTCAELAAIIADLPRGQPAAQPPEPVWAHDRRQKISSLIWARDSGSKSGTEIGLVQGWMWLRGLDDGDAGVESLDLPDVVTSAYGLSKPATPSPP